MCGACPGSMQQFAGTMVRGALASHKSAHSHLLSQFKQIAAHTSKVHQLCSIKSSIPSQWAQAPPTRTPLTCCCRLLLPGQQRAAG